MNVMYSTLGTRHRFLRINPFLKVDPGAKQLSPTFATLQIRFRIVPVVETPLLNTIFLRRNERQLTVNSVPCLVARRMLL
jgi:hypothetical protein